MLIKLTAFKILTIVSVGKVWETRQAYKLLMGVEIDNILLRDDLAVYRRHFNAHTLRLNKIAICLTELVTHREKKY